MRTDIRTRRLKARLKKLKKELELSRRALALYKFKGARHSQRRER